MREEINQIKHHRLQSIISLGYVPSTSRGDCRVQRARVQSLLSLKSNLLLWLPRRTPTCVHGRIRNARRTEVKFHDIDSIVLPPCAGKTNHFHPARIKRRSASHSETRAFQTFNVKDLGQLQVRRQIFWIWIFENVIKTTTVIYTRWDQIGQLFKWWWRLVCPT